MNSVGGVHIENNPCKNLAITRGKVQSNLICVVPMLVVLLVLSACAPASATVEALTQIALVTPTQSLRPMQQTTPSPSPTTKTTFTSTLTPTNTSTATPTLPTNTPSPTATGPTPTSGPSDQIIFSPDSKYVAKRYSEYSYYTRIPTIEILDNKGLLLWIISYQDAVPTGDPRPSLSLYKWSKDSSALYFYYAFSYDGALTLWTGFNLQTINIATGDIQRVLPGEGLMAFSLSPDENRIAYVRNQDQPRRLIIHNFLDNTEQSAVLDLTSESNTQAGWILWSPRGDKVLFHTESRERIQAILLDIGSMEQKLLLEFLAESYWFNGWSGDTVRYLTYPDNEVISIDLETGSTTTLGTATPIP